MSLVIIHTHVVLMNQYNGENSEKVAIFSHYALQGSEAAPKELPQPLRLISDVFS